MMDFRADEIEPGLWIGPAPTSPEDFQALARLGIQDIVTLQTEDEARNGGVHPVIVFRITTMLGMVLHRVPIVDFDPSSLRSGARAAVTTVAELRARERKVYLHCHAGVNRSPTIAALYLVQVKGLDPAAACADVRERRSCGMPEEEVIRRVLRGGR